MITVDTRSRFVNDAVSLDPATFVDEHVPALPEGRSVDAGRGAARLGLGAAHAQRGRRAADVLRRGRATRGGARRTTMRSWWPSTVPRSPIWCRTSRRRSGCRWRDAPRSSAATSTRSSSGSRCCGASSTAARSTSRGRSRSSTGPARRSTCTGRSRSTTTRPRSDTSSPRRATCTSKACSPRRRWPRCRPSSTPRSPPPSATTARRGGRARAKASGTRRGSSASTSSRRRCAS